MFEAGKYGLTDEVQTGVSQIFHFWTKRQKFRTHVFRQKDKKMGHPTSNSAGFMTAQGPEEAQKCIFNNKPLFLCTGLFGLLG